MELNESRRTAWSAAEAAEVYQRGRPDYAEATVDWALDPVRDRPGLRAMDLAAGTGQLTRALLARGVDTVSVEPSAAMRRRLARAVRPATVLAGSAERLPLPDRSVDLVVVGQAFHWFDRDRALPEIVRVLRPGGVLATFYNAREDSVAWVRALSELMGEDDDHASVSRHRAPADLGPPLGSPETLRAEHEQQLDAATLADLVRSRSYVIRMRAPRRSALLDRVAELTRTHPQLVGRQHFSMPYLTTCERYTLRS